MLPPSVSLSFFLSSCFSKFYFHLDIEIRRQLSSKRWFIVLTDLKREGPGRAMRVAWGGMDTRQKAEAGLGGREVRRSLYCGVCRKEPARQGRQSWD